MNIYQKLDHNIITASYLNECHSTVNELAYSGKIDAARALNAEIKEDIKINKSIELYCAMYY